MNKKLMLFLTKIQPMHIKWRSPTCTSIYQFNAKNEKRNHRITDYLGHKKPNLKDNM